MKYLLLLLLPLCGCASSNIEDQTDSTVTEYNSLLSETYDYRLAKANSYLLLIAKNNIVTQATPPKSAIEAIGEYEYGLASYDEHNRSFNMSPSNYPGPVVMINEFLCFEYGFRFGMGMKNEKIRDRNWTEC